MRTTDPPPNPLAPAAAEEAGQQTAAQPATAPAGLARTAGVIGIATMTSRILGLVREQVIAYLFGAGNATDAYNVAFRIPNLVRDLFAEGAMSAAFVPTFTRRLVTGSKADGWRLGNQVLNALLLSTGVLVLLGILFAWPLTMLLAADFAEVPGKVALTVSLTRIMMPFLTLVAVAAALMGMLNALRQFFIPALSPAMFNVASIASAIALVPLMPRFGLPPITAIAIGALIGGFGQVALQWPALRRQGFRYRATLDWRDPGLREILRMMGPGTIGLAAVQVNLLVNTVLAAGEGTGAVSYLNYAFRIMYLPIGLFGVSIATAAVPEISRHAARDDRIAMAHTVSSSLRLMLMLTVPATFGLIVLAHPIVALLFERGSFGAAATAGTAGALAFYSPGLLGYSAVKIGVPSFYALKDSRTPVVVSVLSMVTNVVLSVTLVRWLGYRGLALGTGCAAIVNATVLFWLLRRRLGTLDGRRLAIALIKIVAASLVMSGAVLSLDRWIASAFPHVTLVARLLRVGADIAAGVLVLGLSARILRIREFDEAVRRATSRIGRRRAS